MEASPNTQIKLGLSFICAHFTIYLLHFINLYDKMFYSVLLIDYKNYVSSRKLSVLEIYLTLSPAQSKVIC